MLIFCLIFVSNHFRYEFLYSILMHFVQTNKYKLYQLVAFFFPCFFFRDKLEVLSWSKSGWGQFIDNTN